MTEVQFAKQFLTTLDSKNTKYQSDYAFDPKTFQLRIPYTLPKLAHPPHPPPPKTSTTAPAPGSERVDIIKPPTIDIVLKSTRNPNFTLTLPSLPPTTPITTLKSQIQSLLSGTVAAEKIKILYNKKPIPTSKSTVNDVLTNEVASVPSEVEFGVMVMGGAADPNPTVQTVNLNNEIEAPGPGSKNAAVEATIGVNPEDSMKGVQGSTQTMMDQVNSKLQQQQSEPVQPGDSSASEILKTTEFWDDLQGFLEQRLKDGAQATRLRGVFEKAAAAV